MPANLNRKNSSKLFKVERLEARISAQEKELFLRAATIQGRTLTEFVVSALHDAAMQVVREREVIRLAEKDRKLFVEALLNPPEPNANLKAAAKRYKQRMGRI